MKIRLLSVGKDKGPTSELAEEYGERIRRFADLEILELRAAGPAKEAEDLLSKARGELWALDERGILFTSARLAARLGKLRDSAQALTLAVGGDEGLSQQVRDQARLLWSLSPLTLPHRLARVVALEQIYRAFEILRGGPYHK
ncbi:MAG TPA: 23S rRNA (pseudouridine(1915)-N(3))-methyltransferase RlmH [Myxococcales bacterium]|nr:23S rRNA (pseudouridine(1915)-N(3))-methyltransferase RlmH [Myxococcales bacterium]